MPLHPFVSSLLIRMFPSLYNQSDWHDYRLLANILQHRSVKGDIVHQRLQLMYTDSAFSVSLLVRHSALLWRNARRILHRVVYQDVGATNSMGRRTECLQAAGKKRNSTNPAHITSCPSNHPLRRSPPLPLLAQLRLRPAPVLPLPPGQ